MSLNWASIEIRKMKRGRIRVMVQQGGGGRSKSSCGKRQVVGVIAFFLKQVKHDKNKILILYHVILTYIDAWHASL
jgi:hypothetical protein